MSTATPPAPPTPPEWPKFVRLEQPSLSDIWHNSFLEASKRKAAEKGLFSNDPSVSDAATLEDKIAIRDGKQPLPPFARIRLDCNPTFEPAITTGRREDAGPNYIPWPELLVERISHGNVLESITLGEKGGYGDEGGLARIQAPDREDGVYQRSQGYSPIVILGGWAGEPTQLRFTMSLPGFTSPSLLIPWAAQK